MSVKTAYIIKLVSKDRPEARHYFREFLNRRLIMTSHPALARTFESRETARQFISEGFGFGAENCEIHTYMGRSAQ
jgi:chlorite dismutase